MMKDFGGLFTIEQPGSNHIVVPPPEPGSASVSTRMAPTNNFTDAPFSLLD